MSSEYDALDPDELADDRLDVARNYEQSRVAHDVTAVFTFIRNVVVLHALDEMPLDEVAGELGRKRSDVERAWKNGRDLLKEHI